MNPLNLLFPPKCVLCGKTLPPSSPHSEPCLKCLRDLPVLSEPMFEIGGVICLAPLKFGGQARAGILGLKFGNRLSSARYFSKLMARCLKQFGLTDFDAVTWIPVSRARERRRGYNQSELFAREISREINARPRRLLYKTRHTRPNSSLKTAGERRANVSGAFAMLPLRKIAGKDILLIDDVITSGSTVRECANILLANGAAKVVVLAAARAGH